MMDIDFTALVQQKIEERREGRSAAVRAAVEADARFSARAEPLRVAVSEMVKRLSATPAFANGVGDRELTVKRNDKEGREGTIKVSGEAGGLMFQIIKDDLIWMQIVPSWPVTQALGCDMVYGAGPIEGNLADIDDLIDRGCDHIADFLADIYLSPAAHVVTNPAR